ncbi:hypothetical protein GGH20_001183, partial [Coemansia sp. RSA 1937]
WPARCWLALWLVPRRSCSPIHSRLSRSGCKSKARCSKRLSVLPKPSRAAAPLRLLKSLVWSGSTRAHLHVCCATFRFLPFTLPATRTSKRMCSARASANSACLIFCLLVQLLACRLHISLLPQTSLRRGCKLLPSKAKPCILVLPTLRAKFTRRRDSRRSSKADQPVSSDLRLSLARRLCATNYSTAWSRSLVSLTNFLKNGLLINPASSLRRQLSSMPAMLFGCFMTLDTSLELSCPHPN